MAFSVRPQILKCHRIEVSLFNKLMSSSMLLQNKKGPPFSKYLIFTDWLTFRELAGN